MADATKAIVCLLVTWPIPRLLVVCDKKHFPVILLHSASGKFPCYSQEQEKLKEMKEHLEESMSYHEKEIKHHEDAIRRHRKAMDKHQKGIEKLSDAESSDDEKK